MATIEQRIQALEQAVDNSRITPQLPQLISVEGNETINIWSKTQGRLCQYSYADVIASGSVDPTNDIIPIFKQVPNINFNLDVPTQIASYINNETDFEKTGSQVIYYFVTRKVLNSSSDSGFDFQREFYLFAKIKGTYGITSGVTVLSQELVKQTPNIDQSGSIQEININATSPYDIETVVNGSTAFTPIPSATILFNILVDGATNEYYLYQGKTTEDMGTGGYTSVSGDYIDLQTASPDPSSGASQVINDVITVETSQTLNTNNQIVLIDASSNIVTVTLPPLGSGCQKTLVGYDATNVITINTDGTEEIRRSINNVATTDNLVEGDILIIVDVGTHWQVI